VIAASDRYMTVWSGQINGTKMSAYVVGTVGDVPTERQRLEAIYPYNLCVIAVPFSWNELVATQKALDAEGRPWHTFIDRVSDRIHISMVRLVTEMADALRPYSDQIVVQPILTPDG